MARVYVPTEAQVRAWCREGTGDYPDVMDEWLDRFLARVRRDAAREAEAERDEWRQTALDERAAALDQMEQAQIRDARIKAVRELHSESRIIPGTPVFGCAECGEPNETEPCATIRALDGDA